MNPIRSILAATLTFLLVVTNPAHAEDIDIYTGSSSGGAVIETTITSA